MTKQIRTIANVLHVLVPCKVTKTDNNGAPREVTLIRLNEKVPTVDNPEFLTAWIPVANFQPKD